jgi:hypothetical protein
LSVRVLINRRDGFADPVELSVDGLPAGLTARPVRIAANQNDATLIVVADETAATWTGPIRVIGRSITSGEPIERVAETATFVWGVGEQRDFIRSRISRDLVLAVTGDFVVPISVALGTAPAAAEPAPAATEPAPATEAAPAAQPPAKIEPFTITATPGTNVSVPVRLTRRDGGGGAITLRPRNLPPGVTAAEVAIAADQSEGAIEVKIAADAAPGSYSFSFLGETKVTFKPTALAEARELTAFIPSTTANLELTAAP